MMPVSDIRESHLDDLTSRGSSVAGAEGVDAADFPPTVNVTRPSMRRFLGAVANPQSKAFENVWRVLDIEEVVYRRTNRDELLWVGDDVPEEWMFNHLDGRPITWRRPYMGAADGQSGRSFECYFGGDYADGTEYGIWVDVAVRERPRMDGLADWLDGQRRTRWRDDPSVRILHLPEGEIGDQPDLHQWLGALTTPALEARLAALYSRDEWRLWLELVLGVKGRHKWQSIESAVVAAETRGLRAAVEELVAPRTAAQSG